MATREEMLLQLVRDYESSLQRANDLLTRTVEELKQLRTEALERTTSLIELRAQADTLSAFVETVTEGSLIYTGLEKGCNDYVLKAGNNAWITVGRLTVYIRTCDAGEPMDGLVIEVAPVGQCEEVLTSCEAMDEQAKCPHCGQFCYEGGDDYGCDGFLANGFQLPGRREWREEQKREMGNPER